MVHSEVFPGVTAVNSVSVFVGHHAETLLEPELQYVFTLRLNSTVNPREAQDNERCGETGQAINFFCVICTNKHTHITDIDTQLTPTN